MRRPRLPALLGVLCLAAALVACAAGAAPLGPPEPTPSQPASLREQAAAEATAIVERAQATAMVLQAQAQATALVLQGQAPAAAPQALPVLPSPTPVPSGEEVDAGPTVTATLPMSEDAPTVELLGVGFAADGAMLIVNYRAPLAVAATFWPGVLSVTDEATGTLFNEVPVMPVIGVMIARPVEPGQVGYVMLVHVPPVLRRGSLVTVALGEYVFEHVPVE